MTDGFPGWRPFDLADDSICSHPVLTEQGVFALVSSGRGHEGGWGPDLALAAALKAAADGRLTTLYDLAIDRPRLHRVAVAPAGGLGGEGVTDMVRYGASHERVLRKLTDSLHLVTAGTVDHDAAAVIEDESLLERVRSRCADTGAAALLYVSADAPGAPSLVAGAEGVVWIAGRDEPLPDWLANGPTPIVARWGPQAGPGPDLEAGTAVAGGELEAGGIEIEPEWPEFQEPLVVADPGEIDPEVASMRTRPSQPAPFDFGVDVDGDSVFETAPGASAAGEDPADVPERDPWEGTDGAAHLVGTGPVLLPDPLPESVADQEGPAVESGAWESVHPATAEEPANAPAAPDPGTPTARPSSTPTSPRMPRGSSAEGNARTVRRGRRGPRPFLLVLFALFLLTIAVLAWAGYVEIPVLDRLLGDLR